MKGVNEIYEEVRDHLLKQGKRSTAKGGTVFQYRGDYGLKCGIGALIEDEFYFECMEEHSVDEEIVMTALEKSGVLINAETIALMRLLQIIHDRRSPELWADELNRVKPVVHERNISF